MIQPPTLGTEGFSTQRLQWGVSASSLQHGGFWDGAESALLSLSGENTSLTVRASEEMSIDLSAYFVLISFSIKLLAQVEKLW